VVVHLDHGRDLDVVRRSIDLGLSSVMYDGSDLPMAENIKRTRAVVEMAHRAGVSVEGEIATFPCTRTSPAGGDRRAAPAVLHPP